MIRVVLYFILLAALAYGGMLLIQNPGHITITWYGHVVNASAVLGIAAIAVTAIVVWLILRLILGLPSTLAYTARRRRREKGYSALTQGLIAVGSGDARTAGRAATQANHHLKNDALALMLRAQAAHLAGDGLGAQAAYEDLADREDTRILGFRGLYVEASRRGDDEAARHFAAAAHRASPLPWSAQAVLEHRASDRDWERALATVESSVAARLIDKETGNRQRAVLETAIAMDKEMSAPDDALALARSAIKRAPDLAPAVVVAAHLLTRRGDIRKASRLIEKAWPRIQHPNIAEAYLNVRPGDSTSDKLARAKTLMGLSAFDPVARMTVTQAAIANRDFASARSAMEPLIGEGKRPTIKMCMLMAELEENEHGSAGLAREWQARAHHAAHDPAWVADGIVYDAWAPISPTTGRLDAFAWQVPIERTGRVMDAIPTHQPVRVSSEPAAMLAERAEDERIIAPENGNLRSISAPAESGGSAENAEQATVAGVEDRPKSFFRATQLEIDDRRPQPTASADYPGTAAESTSSTEEAVPFIEAPPATASTATAEDPTRSVESMTAAAEPFPLVSEPVSPEPDASEPTQLENTPTEPAGRRADRRRAAITSG